MYAPMVCMYVCSNAVGVSMYVHSNDMGVCVYVCSNAVGVSMYVRSNGMYVCMLQCCGCKYVCTLQ
jgi:hypothetical protein